MSETGWDQLRIFLAVYRGGSFNAAAATTGLHQSTINRQVRLLERRMRVQLFTRSPRGLVPTAAALSLARQAESIERQVDGIFKAGPGEIGPIVLWAPDGSASYFLAPLLRSYAGHHPEARISVLSSEREPDLHAFEAGEVDVALIFTPPHPNLIRLARERRIFAPVTSRDYVARHGSPATLAELGRHHLSTDTRYPTGGEWAAWTQAFAAAGPARFRTSSSTQLAIQAAFGQAIAMLSADLPRYNDRWLRLDVEGYQASIEMWLVCPQRVRDGARFRPFLNHLKQWIDARADDGPVPAFELLFDLAATR